MPYQQFATMSEASYVIQATGWINNPIVSTLWTRGKISLEIPTFLSMEWIHPKNNIEMLGYITYFVAAKMCSFKRNKKLKFNALNNHSQHIIYLQGHFFLWASNFILDLFQLQFLFHRVSQNHLIIIIIKIKHRIQRLAWWCL